MKNDSIQQMLERYREGTLSDSELAELNRLARRDEVMEAAGRRADGIIRRRRSVAFTVAGLLVAGAAVWSLLPQGGTAEPVLVAEATVKEEVPVESPTVLASPESHENPVSQSGSVSKATPARKVQRSLPEDEAPVVVCNNQCEADSVISDIWKFLTV